MRLKFIRRDRGSFSGGLLPFLPVCCRDRAERVLAVRVMYIMLNEPEHLKDMLRRLDSCMSKNFWPISLIPSLP